ncbi:MAG: hypothetical protein KBD78_08835 [Oligoflexales bacterium]|nr:hypothetical protein [Oligoflexales bacterium]
MEQDRNRDKRLNTRHLNLTGKLPGKLFSPEKQAYITARAIDVSKGGMCILIENSLPRGCQLWMLLDGNYIKFEVSNCRRSSQEKNLWRCGLSRIDTNINVIELFENNGCFNKAYST